MRGHVIAAFFVLTTLNIQAEQPRYRFIGTLKTPGFGLTPLGGVRNGVAGYWGLDNSSGDLKAPGILASPTGWTNLDETYGVQSARVNGVGDRVIGVSWRSSDGTDGYLYDGKLTKFKRSPNYLGMSVELSGGGGDWVGGRIVFNEAGAGATDDPIGSIAIGYNPVTDQRVEFQEFYHNKFIASNPEGTMLFMSSQNFIEQVPLFSSHAMYTLTNGVQRYIGPGWAHDLNDHGDVLYSRGDWPLLVKDRFGNDRHIPGASAQDYIPVTSGEIDNAGRVVVWSSSRGNSYVSWGGRLHRLDDCIEGGGSANGAMLDPVTGYLYTGSGRIYAPVPEPGTLAALGLGVAAMLRRRRGA